MEAIKIKAMYRNGVLEPEEPLVLSEGENVTVIIESRSDFSEEKKCDVSKLPLVVGKRLQIKISKKTSTSCAA